MTIRSLGLRTDILALGPGSTVEPAEGGYALRTTAEPDYWSANALIRTTAPGTPDAESARFARAFPQAKHLRIVWDGFVPEAEAQAGDWAARGGEVEVDDVLARDGAPPPSPLPEGYAIRPLATGEDWDRSFALNRLTGAEDGFGGLSHDAYLRRRRDARARGVAEGWLRWWGVWAGGELAAQMGLAEGEGLARFQHVETHPVHRRRGLCAALLARVGAEARAPRLIIVAAAEGEAGRLYRSAGFAPVERVAAVVLRERAQVIPPEPAAGATP